MMNKSSAPAVTLRDLTVRRGSHDVLRHVDLALPRGSITGLLGPSGCGKTTLIRSIAGLQRLRGGSVDVLGAPPGSRDNRRRVAYVTQTTSVYADLGVRQNLRYTAALVGADHDAVEEALADVDLIDRADSLVSTLSGGQRTRVSLACALLARADLYLLDEPTVGLDPVLRRDLWVLFRSLCDRGATLLVSSHVMDEAARCDQVVLLRDGGIVSHSTPSELLDRTGASDLESAFLAIAEQEAA